MVLSGGSQGLHLWVLSVYRHVILDKSCFCAQISLPTNLGIRLENIYFSNNLLPLAVCTNGRECDFWDDKGCSSIHHSDTYWGLKSYLSGSGSLEKQISCERKPRRLGGQLQSWTKQIERNDFCKSLPCLLLFFQTSPIIVLTLPQINSDILSKLLNLSGPWFLQL